MNIKKIYCWSDSQVSLAWIKAKHKEFKMFVQNRVIKIRENVRGEDWHYCRTNENPADIITRGNTYPNFDLWWNGPESLVKTDVRVYEAETNPHYLNEVATIKVVLHASMNKPYSIGNLIDISRFNDLLKLFRVTAYVLRFARNLKAKLKGVSLVLKKYIIFTELKEAKFLWVKDNQSWFDVSSNDDSRLHLNLKKDDNRNYTFIQ